MNCVYVEAAVAEQHRQDLLHEAEQLRLARQLQASARHAGSYRKSLVWLGDHLVAWGWWLRVRYGAVEHVVENAQ